jgi:hypothetical protein
MMRILNDEDIKLLCMLCRMNKNEIPFYYFIPIFLGAFFLLTSGLLFPQPSESANLTSVKNTQSNSRLSYVGTVDGTNSTSGSSILYIDTGTTAGWASSINNFNLFSGDDLMIGDNTDYTVVDIINDDDDNKIQVNPALQATDVDQNDPIIATRSAQHTVTFTPVSQINDGSFRVRIKATGSGSSAASIDGMPDSDGFDFTESFDPGWLSCSTGTTALEYGGGTNCPDGWTCIFCDYSGNNDTSEKTVTIGTTTDSEQPINPAPSSTSKTPGVADTYSFYVDHLDSNDDTVDSTHGKIAVVESVRVTAVVEPSIEFEIIGVNDGESACGVNTDVGTSAPYVAFSTLQISDFVDAAQKLKAATNASSGYSVTAEEANEMQLIGATGPITGTTIPDTTCDDGCTEAVGTGWTDPDNNGLGYSLENVTGTPASFEYSDDTSGFLARHFPNIGNGETAYEIMSSAGPANTEEIHVCYRITISSIQQAGTYENDVTYIATANF